MLIKPTESNGISDIYPNGSPSQQTLRRGRVRKCRGHKCTKSVYMVGDGSFCRDSYLLFHLDSNQANAGGGRIRFFKMRQAI